jgi:TolA-binding protein
MINKYDLLKINLDPNLAHVLPEDYLQGRLDALNNKTKNNKSNRCKKNEHWVNNKKSKKGGYCRINRGTESIPKKPASTGLKGLGGGLLLGSLGGASVATIMAASRTKTKVESEIKQTDKVIESVKTEANKNNNESKVEELNIKLKESEVKIKELQTEIESRNKEIITINEALNKRKATIASLEQSNLAEKQIKETTQKIEQYEKQLKVQGDETKRAREELSSAKKEHIAEINDYQKQLNQKQVELSKLNGELESQKDKVLKLENALLINPITKPGGGSGSEDPNEMSSKKVPLEPDIRNKKYLRKPINPDTLDRTDPKEVDRIRKNIDLSIENAKDRQNWMFDEYGDKKKLEPRDNKLLDYTENLTKKANETIDQFRSRLTKEPKVDGYEDIDKLLDDAIDYIDSEDYETAQLVAKQLLNSEWGEDAKNILKTTNGNIDQFTDVNSLPLRFLRKSIEEGRELNAVELGQLFKEEVDIFRKNPLLYVKEANDNDKLVFDTLTRLKNSGELEKVEKLLGYEIPTTRIGILAKASGLSTQDSAAILGSLTGSTIGSTVGGLPGAIIGDFTGAETARKAAVDVTALNNVRNKLRDDDLFKSMTPLEKIQYARILTLIEVQDISAKQDRGISGDIGGALAGNTFGALGSSIGITGAGGTLLGTYAGYRGAKAGNRVYDQVNKSESTYKEAIPEEILQFIFPTRPGIITKTKKNYKRLGKLSKLIKKLKLTDI